MRRCRRSRFGMATGTNLDGDPPVLSMPAAAAVMAHPVEQVPDRHVAQRDVRHRPPARPQARWPATPECADLPQATAGRVGTPAAIAKRLGIARSSVYRVLGA